MKNIFALVGAAVIGFVVLGFFLGWYKIQSTPTSTGPEFKVDLNSPKISEDIHQGEDKVRNWLNHTTPKDNPAPSHQVVQPKEPDGKPAVFQNENGGLVLPGGSEPSSSPPPLPPSPPPLPKN